LGAGKWNGEGMGRGRSVYKQPGTRVDEDRTTRKEGFQISKRDSGTKGAIKGVTKGLCHVLSVVNLYICIMLCVIVANKRIVFRL
jgi:hypothetical protein